MTSRAIERSDILLPADYVKVRAERRKRITELKQLRRLEVGPFATFYFESYDTMLHQVLEMLYIERGGEAQIADELAAYIRLGGAVIRGVPETDQERSREDGKASSVQFIRFGFAPAEIAAFRSGDGDVIVGFEHEKYGHMAVMPKPVRQALATDFT
jgi:hypothetical protein